MKKNLAWLAVPALMLSLSACDSEPGSVTSRGDDAPTVSIQPGKFLNFKVAFTLKDPADINMDVSPIWMHDSVNFATR